jgi:uncharacterized membrane protein YkoI
MRYRTTLLTLIAILLTTGPLWLPPVRQAAYAHDDHDEDMALRALEAGEIIALDQVLATLGSTVPGEISEIELERENGNWIYEFKVISPEGHMLKVRVDAKTGKLIKPEG